MVFFLVVAKVLKSIRLNIISSFIYLPTPFSIYASLEVVVDLGEIEKDCVEKLTPDFHRISITIRVSNAMNEA